MGKAFATFTHPFWKQKKLNKISPVRVGCLIWHSLWHSSGRITNSLPALLKSASFSRAKRRPAGSAHEQVHGSTEILTARTLPRRLLICLAAFWKLWRVNWADLWDGEDGEAGRERGRERSAFPTGVPDQHAQIRGNLFHNLAASCFPRLCPHRRQRHRFGPWPSPFVGLLIHATCAELDSPLILLAL